MSSTLKWEVRQRCYNNERNQCWLRREETSSHPLKAITVTVTESRPRKLGRGSRSSSVSSLHSSSVGDPLTSAVEASDPLSLFAAQAEDPLSKPATDPLSATDSYDPIAQAAADIKGNRSSPLAPVIADEFTDPHFQPWSKKKMNILNRFTTSEKLSITTSFLSGSGSDRGSVKTPASSTVSDKVKNRLEQLDDFEEGSVQEMLNLSQQEYVKRIEELNTALIHAWDMDQRVRALKIAIQCSKLLADVSVIQFYPSKFVLITDILDTFGRLVFDRIKSKATYLPRGATKPVQLPDDFTPDQVPESAKETCRNWFFKIASIRELVPRFYVETAILKCYAFLTSGEYNKALRRLGLMTRGIGDPLVSLYTRCYLCRVGLYVAPDIQDHLSQCFDDFLFSYKQIESDNVQNNLAIQKLDLPRYLTLFSPALDWILQCISHNTSERVLEDILHKSGEQCNSALLMNSVLSTFKPEYIASRAIQFTARIKNCEETGFPKHLLYKALGDSLIISDPPDSDKLTLLNEVWKIVVKLKNPSDYIICAETWIEYVVKNFSKREIDTILADIIRHMTPDRAYEDHYSHLQNIVSKILAHLHDFALLFSLEKFLPFLDMFQKESVKVEVCKNIMESYCRNQTEPTSDPVITNALMFLCKTMHDSVNALSLEDDIRQISQLIINFVRTISFSRDFEQQLSFYVECRASFSNIDSVIVYLVQCVNTLALQTRKIVKGDHTRKTAAFVRACVAYCYITIPSLHGILQRLNLYLLSGQVAVANLCLSQADAFFKAAISLITEVPRTLEVDGKVRNMEVYLSEYISNLLSALLVVPDNPDQGVLYLVRGLLNVAMDYQWDHHGDTKAMVCINAISLLSAMCQHPYLYTIDRVDSNDRLYGGDGKFVRECTDLCVTLLQDILQHLQNLESPQTYKRQAIVAHELFCRVIIHTDLNDQAMYNLAKQLWVISQKHGQLDTKLSVRTLQHVKRQGLECQAIEELYGCLSIQSRT